MRYRKRRGLEKRRGERSDEAEKGRMEGGGDGGKDRWKGRREGGRIAVFLSL